MKRSLSAKNEGGEKLGIGDKTKGERVKSKEGWIAGREG